MEKRGCWGSCRLTPAETARRAAECDYWMTHALTHILSKGDKTGKRWMQKSNIINLISETLEPRERKLEGRKRLLSWFVQMRRWDAPLALWQQECEQRDRFGHQRSSSVTLCSRRSSGLTHHLNFKHFLQPCTCPKCQKCHIKLSIPNRRGNFATSLVLFL